MEQPCGYISGREYEHCMKVDTNLRILYLPAYPALAMKRKCLKSSRYGLSNRALQGFLLKLRISQNEVADKLTSHSVSNKHATISPDALRCL